MTQNIYLDPEWEMRTLTQTLPRSAQAIFCNDTIIGHRYEGHGHERERVIAAGRDPDVQKILDRWFAEYTAKRDAKRERESAAFVREAEKQKQERASRARAALGLPPIG